MKHFQQLSIDMTRKWCTMGEEFQQMAPGGFFTPCYRTNYWSMYANMVLMVLEFQSDKIRFGKIFVFKYSGAKLRIKKAPFMWWIPTFQDVLMDVESAAMDLASWIISTISESFPMRYCMNLYIKGYQN